MTIVSWLLLFLNYLLLSTTFTEENVPDLAANTEGVSTSIAEENVSTTLTDEETVPDLSATLTEENVPNYEQEITKDECTTRQGKPCTFPFYWKGANHTACTWVDAVGRPWCGLADGRRGECDMNVCEVEQCDQCVTRHFVPCVFPFNYKGETHTKCTGAWSVGGRPWCANAVTESGDAVAMDYCDMECCKDVNSPSTSTTSTTKTTTSTTTTTTTTTTEPPLPCPMEKMNTKGQKVIKKYKKVKKWEDCAQKCQDNKKCQAWTYRPKMKKQKQALLCTIMSKYKSFSKDKFTVSGTSDCPPAPTEPPTGSATSVTSEQEDSWEDIKTTIEIRHEGKQFSCKVDFKIALNTEIKFEEITSKCSEASSDKDSLNLAGVHNFQISTQTGLNLSCSVGAGLLKSSKTLSQDMLEDSLTCKLPENTCYAESGSDFPAGCIFPFIDDGREFHACTDVNSPDPSRTWCATKLDEAGKAEDGRWGYCTLKCGYCAGSPVNVRNKRPCGYDCLLNPFKVEVFS